MEENKTVPALNIKVAVSGQVQSDTRIVYTFPNPYDPQKSMAADTWLRAIFDPREARNFASKKVYAFWHAPQGNYYGMIVPSPDDTRNGRLMITIFVGQRMIRSGKSLVDVFDKLEKMLIMNPSSTDAGKVAALLGTLVVVKDQLGMRSSAAGSIGYRGFEDSAELDKILGNCDQKEYCKYRRILFVPSMALPPTNSMGLSEIRTPIVPYIAPAQTPVAAPRQQPVQHRPQPQPPVKEPLTGAKLIVYIIGGLVGLYLLFAACCGFYAGVVPPFRSSGDVKTEKNEQTDTAKANTDAAIASSEGDMSADIAYLRNNNIWDKSSLTSSNYQTLIDYINNQQIEQIIATDWFAPGEANSLWLQIYNILKGHPEKMEQMKSAMAATCINGKVMLESLNTRLEEIVSGPAVPAMSEPAAPAPRHETPRREAPRHETPRPKKADKPVGSAKKKVDNPAAGQGGKPQPGVKKQRVKGE